MFVAKQRTGTLKVFSQGPFKGGSDREMMTPDEIIPAFLVVAFGTAEITLSIQQAAALRSEIDRFIQKNG